MPCVPNTISPWIKGKKDVAIRNKPTLLETSKLMCAWSGTIKIKDPGQDLVRE